jgi:hypothetical protein
MRRLARKYVLEVGWSGIAYAASAFALLPTVMVGFGMYVPIIYLYIFVFGALEILAFALLSSLLDHFAWKAACYALVLAANLIVFSGIVNFGAPEAGNNMTGLVLIQLLFTFPMFYLLIRRDLPSHFWSIAARIEDEAPRPREGAQNEGARRSEPLKPR